MTWQDVQSFIKANGLDAEEYLIRTGGAAFTKTLVWTPKTTGFIVSFAPGSNEGFYVLVEQTFADTIKRDPVMIGKFWRPDGAANAVKMLTKFLYNIG